MQQRQLGPFTSLRHRPGLHEPEPCLRRAAPAGAGRKGRCCAALDAGVTLFDTAALYGFGANETLVGKVLAKHRSRFTLASKCGMQGVDVAGDGKLRARDRRPARHHQAPPARPACAACRPT